MALRRLAQQNRAATTSGSPRSPDSGYGSPVSARDTVANGNPSTPRNPRPSFDLYRSPASTPSISSSTPFDWEAARSRRPPPYATPPQNKGRKSMGVGGTPGTPARRAVVRKKGFIEKIVSIPSRIAFEIAVFPNNVPLPSPKTSARLIGGSLHFLNLCVRVSQVRKVPDSDLGWEDMYREGEGSSWFDWTIPMTILLVGASFLNAVYLFSRIKLYRLHRTPDPVSSPNASFVNAQFDFEPLEPPSLVTRMRTAAWFSFSRSWRWLLGMKPPASFVPAPGKMSRVQQLQVWTPGELEMALFSAYSPAHAFLWMATGSSNWMMMTLVMVLVGVQSNTMTHSYKLLLKDKEIIAAEVMNEYNQVFVNPRINPIRHDVAVMTHQSEVVNVWED